MGKSVSQVKQEAQQQNIEDEKMANDALNSMMTIAETNLQLFYARIKSTDDNTQIPISKFIRDFSMIECGVDQDAEKVKEAVGSVLGDIANLDFLGAITNVVNVGLDVLLGRFAGNTSMYDAMTVSVGSLGGFYRIDYYMYGYEFTSDSLAKITKNCICVAVVISSINTADLDKNTVNVILQTAYPNSDYDELRILQQDVYKALGWDDPQKESGFKPSDPVKSLKWKMEHVYDVPNDKIVKEKEIADESNDDIKEDK